MRAEDLAWPIADYDALAAAFGGDTVPLEVEGRTVTLAELRSALPAYYFPIRSEPDLRTKLADAAARAERGVPDRTPTPTPAGPQAPESGDCWS